MSRALVGLSLWLALSACPSTSDPRPFGVEMSTVTIEHGGTAVIGFRIARADGGMPPALTITPPGLLRAEMLSRVPEDDAWAGGLFLTSDFGTTPGVYVVTLGEHTITATVSEIPPANNSVRTSRRSTVAQLDHPYVGVGQLSVLTESGEIWRLTADGGTARVEGLSAIRAIAGGPNEGVAYASLDSPVVDVRATQGGVLELLADGSLRSAGNATMRNVTAVRPYFAGGPAQAQIVLALKDDGSVANSAPPVSLIRGAVDLIPGGQTFLRSDGIVFDVNQTAFSVAYSPVFAFRGLKVFDGSAYETFSGQTAEYRHQSLWVTPDGVAWIMRSDRNPEPIVPPEGVQFVDVFARGRGAYALGDDKRLYDLTSATLRLPFENVRSSEPRPELGIFSDPIPGPPGQSITVPLRVVRDGYEKAVVLSPSGFPADITAAPVSIPAQATTAMLTLTYSADRVARAQVLRFTVTGEGFTGSALLQVELTPSPRRTTIAKDLALKADGTVWRIVPGPAVQLPGLSNIISITDNMALDAQGVVYSFGDNSLGQLGRVTVGTSDPMPAPVPGLPPIQVIAHSTYQVNLSLALDRTGKVWLFGASQSSSSGGNSTPTQLMNVAPMVDVYADGSPTGLDADGNAWNLQGASSGLIGGRHGRLGVRNGASSFFPITPKGFIGQIPNILWYTNWATLVEGRGVGRLSEPFVALPGSQGAAYASAEGIIVKDDGTLWKLRLGQDGFDQMPGLTGFALPR